MGLTHAEQETIINTNRAEDVAYIYTAEPKIITRLKNNPAAVLVEEGMVERSPWARFTFPASLISFRTMRRTVTLTDEQKQELRDRLARNTRDTPGSPAGGAQSLSEPSQAP